jgi:uncharacterized protein YecT (DUF1311 family)
MKAFPLLFALVILAASSALAQNTGPECGPTASKCANLPFPQMRECIQSLADTAEQGLNTQYQALRATVSGLQGSAAAKAKALAALKSAERAWSSGRKKTCDFASGSLFTGMNASDVYATCRCFEARGRTNSLKRIQDDISNP